MKLRSIICASAVAVMMAATAEYVAPNIFARLKVDSTLKSEIIAIPFAGCGESSAHIYVTNLVMTTGLANGDTLMYKSGSTWHAWQITGAVGDTPGTWEAITTSTTKGGMTVTPAAGSALLDCGKACWLIRNTPSSYYLYGQVNGTMPTSVEVAHAASASKVAYTIIAKPKEKEPLDLNTWKGAKGMNEGDTIQVLDDSAAYSTTYYYDGSDWCTNGVTSTQVVTTPRGKEVTQNVYGWCAISTSVTIPAGKGFLYGRKGNPAENTLKW